MFLLDYDLFILYALAMFVKKIMKVKKMKLMIPHLQGRSQPKATWSETFLNDLIDIIVSDEYVKRKLIFQTVRNQ